MKIDSVSLKSFKRFTQLDIRGIPQGANAVILVGPNGCGKSSIFEAFFQFFRARVGVNQRVDESYFNKGEESIGDSRRHIDIQFHGGSDISGRHDSMHFRTAYRHTADLDVGQIQKLGAPSDANRINRMIDADSSVSQNYQRLIAASLHQFYNCENDAKPVLEVREQLIGALAKSMGFVFDDLTLANIVDPFDDGSFYFKKGATDRYHYKNLSAGEKAAFDLLLDFHLSAGYFKDSVFCIDEPELHMHTALQARLFNELFCLTPDDSQIWISTHSLGIIREANRINSSKPDSVAILDFSGHDFDAPVVIYPSKASKIEVEKVLSVALEGSESETIPKNVFLCEGSFGGRRRQNFDSEVYNTLFPNDDAVFVSGGSCEDILNLESQARHLVGSLFTNSKVIGLIDRDERSEAEVMEIEAAGATRILPRRNLESYLLDDAVLAQWLLGQGGISVTEQELTLVRAGTISELADQGRSIVIVALIQESLHIRMFAPDGTKLVDKPESELHEGPDLESLKALFQNKEEGSPSLSREDKVEVMKQAARSAEINATENLIAAKEALLQESAQEVNRRNAPDDCKSIAGNLLVHLNKVCGLRTIGSNRDTFLKYQLAPILAQGGAAFDELKEAIFRNQQD